ncbi:response regulator [Candidatus Enterovibrio escicola]|uniref:histidine kinase n=1 Tax=Candidatus Enterovibrio escicola TaxID=1927127 RepID=A0A2A5T121_9GAMM|nr:response regulator [Candidatus Enterovibrio escacola]PCS21869.1 sensory box histidine kinase/response regulator [Candidatus Enterovibrio escacola]
MKIIHLPLWLKYITLVISLTGGLSYVAGEVIRSFEKQYLEQQMDTQIKANFSALTSILAVDVIADQRGFLDKKLRGLAIHYPDLCYVSIVNRNGVQVGQWGDRPHSDNPMALNFTNSVNYANQYVGSMRISLSKKQMMKDINYHVDQMRLYTAVTLLTLATIIYLISQFLILSPIARINQRLISIAHANPDIDKWHDELSRLDSCADNLEEYIRDHEEHEAALEEARSEAVSANIAKSQFIATMSHEIRTPMNAIIGVLDILEEENLPECCKSLTAMAGDAANLLLSQLNDILDYSKIDVGALNVDETEFDVSILAKSVLTLFEASAQKKGISISLCDELNHRFLVFTDKGKLAQVLTNLVNNSLKFTSEGRIELIVSHVFPKGLKIQVKDSGIGIDPVYQNTIFEPFTQKDATFARKYGGVGMGLAISKKLVELLNGKLLLNSKTEVGSEFTILLPCKMRYHRDNQHLGEEQHSYSPTKDTHILLVEDNLANQMVARTMLEKVGFTVLTANNGHEAIAAIKSDHFELILMDLQMPGMDGFEACDVIRHLNEHGKTLPILAMTANVSEQDREKCKKLGMDDFIAKPVSKKHLIDVISNWVGKTHLTLGTQ